MQGESSPPQLVEKVYNYCASYWFSLPFAYKRKQVEGSALVARTRASRLVCRNLRAEARILCAPAHSQMIQKAQKGCGGKQEFSPTIQLLSYKRLSSETKAPIIPRLKYLHTFPQRIGDTPHVRHFSGALPVYHELFTKSRKALCTITKSA